MAEKLNKTHIKNQFNLHEDLNQIVLCTLLTEWEPFQNCRMLCCQEKPRNLCLTDRITPCIEHILLHTKHH